MDVISLLLCRSATDRYAEPKSWLWIALAAMALVLAGAGAELIALWFGFAIALCLRGRAKAAAQEICDALQRAYQCVERSFHCSWKIRKSVHAAEYLETLTMWRRAFTALKALYFHQPNFGLPLVVSPPSI